MKHRFFISKEKIVLNVVVHQKSTVVCNFKQWFAQMLLLMGYFLWIFGFVLERVLFKEFLVGCRQYLPNVILPILLFFPLDNLLPWFLFILRILCYLFSLL